jgi:hypothetical protein
MIKDDLLHRLEVYIVSKDLKGEFRGRSHRFRITGILDKRFNCGKI